MWYDYNISLQTENYYFNSNFWYCEVLLLRQWLIDMRKSRGWNQSDLATEVGVSKSYISEIEKGNRTPSGRKAFEIAKKLEFNMERFFEDEEEHAS
jgi:putative transcriptional regulator